MAESASATSSKSSSITAKQAPLMSRKTDPFCADPLPHPGCDALLLLADGVRVDRGCGELGMPEPLLHHVEGDAPADSLDAETVPQALGAGVGTVRDTRRCYDLLHAPVGCHAAPWPKQRLRLSTPLRLPDAVNQVEGVQQLGRHRHSTVNTLAALLQAFEHDDAA